MVSSSENGPCDDVPQPAGTPPRPSEAAPLPSCTTPQPSWAPASDHRLKILVTVSWLLAACSDFTCSSSDAARFAALADSEASSLAALSAAVAASGQSGHGENKGGREHAGPSPTRSSTTIQRKPRQRWCCLISIFHNKRRRTSWGGRTEANDLRHRVTRGNCRGETGTYKGLQNLLLLEVLLQAVGKTAN